MVFMSLAAHQASAGQYADDMAKCLVNSTTPENRTLLVKWIFSVMSLHPDLAAMSTVKAPQRDALNKDAGALFQHLLIEACKSETQLAIKNEGPATLQYAFQILGQAAVAGIMTDPQVVQGIQDFSKNLDGDKIKAALTPTPQP